MKKRIKFILIVFPVLLVIIFPLNIVMSFTGVPFGSLLAKYYIGNYIEAKYANYNPKIGDIHYNFKNESYSAPILDSQNRNVSEVSYNWRSFKLHDLEYNNEIERELQSDIKALNEKLGPSFELGNASIWVGIKANQDFNSDKLARKNRIYFLNLKGENALSEQDSKDKFISLAKSIFSSLENQYSIDSSQLIYQDNFGMKELIISNAQCKLPNEDIYQLIKVIRRL